MSGVLFFFFFCHFVNHLLHIAGNFAKGWTQIYHFFNWTLNECCSEEAFSSFDARSEFEMAMIHIITVYVSMGCD